MGGIGLIVLATCYHATKSQCNADYLTTAGGYEICSTDSAYSHRYLAVSRDLRGAFPYGTVVTISDCEVEEYNGEWTVADTMNERHTGMVDFLVNPDMPELKSNVNIEKWEQ